jgi:hypothetical protein
MLEVIIIVLLAFIGIMFAAYYFHIQRLETMVKARDLPEYYRTVKKKELLEDPNTIAEEEENEILLDDSRPFDLPADFQLEREGEPGSQKIHIYKD